MKGLTRIAHVGWLMTVLGGIAAGCGGPAATSEGLTPRLLLAHDDAQAESLIAFPTSTFEALMRFDLPEGKHRPLRLWIRAGGAGTYRITVYEANGLEGPGKPVHTADRVVTAEARSDGRDARWVVEDVSEAGEQKGLVWVGIRRVDGEVSLWSTTRDAGHYFMRDTDPKRRIELLAVRRTPLLRLETTLADKN